jgi:hypothetical protein
LADNTQFVAFPRCPARRARRAQRPSPHSARLPEPHGQVAVVRSIW